MAITCLTDNQYSVITQNSSGQALSGVWAFFEVGGCLLETEEIPLEVWGFEKCRHAFLEVLFQLLLDGRIRLAKSGVFLRGSIEEQISIFEKQFPRTLDEVSNAGGLSSWFFSEECPAGAVWILKSESGEEWLEWT